MRTWKVPITFTVDLENRITSWSSGVEVALGYGPESFIGQPLAMLFGPAECEPTVLAQALRMASAEGSATIVSGFVDARGEKVVARGEITALVGADLERTGWSVVMLPPVDKAAEERMRSSHKRLLAELASNRRLQQALAHVAEAEEPQEALGQVVASAIDLFSAERGMVQLLSTHEFKLRIVAQLGHTAEYLDANAAMDFDATALDESFTPGADLTARVAPGTDVMIGQDVMEGAGYLVRWVPLVGLNGRIVGLLSLEWDEAYRFSERQEHDLVVLSHLAATWGDHYVLGLRSREALERLERLAEAQGDELLDAEVRFRRAFEVGPVAACITTVAEDRFLEVNDGYMKLTGYASQEVVGRTSRELGMWSGREDQAQLEEAFERGGGFRELKLRLRTKDGHVRDILLSGEQIMFKGEPSWLKMFNDVTEQHRSQEELMEAIREVMSDPAWFSQSVIQRLAAVERGSTPMPDFELTPREVQVLELVAAGLDDEVIAGTLGLSPKTVRNYLTSVYTKTDVHSRAEAVIWARDRGMVARLS